jgi:uncharacterized membrane protein
LYKNFGTSKKSFKKKIGKTKNNLIYAEIVQVLTMVVPWQLSTNYISFRDAKIFKKLVFLRKTYFVKEIKDLFDMIKNILFSEMEY